MFKQEKDVKHKSKLVLEWIKQANIKLLEWPGLQKLVEGYEKCLVEV